MPQTILFLEADGGGYVEDWSRIEQAIKRGFETGDRVRLEVAHKRDEDLGAERHQLGDFISMTGLPDAVGRYRLVVFPATGLNEKSKVRTWWGPGAFRGTVQDSYDDVWDARTVCTDVNVALELFRELFEHKGVSQRIIDATVSDWDAPTS
ncbi:MAG: hypothetical protein K2P70_11500 [Hyphomonadaceae bacterium]|nr:hypothetical protein [Hyphomonadaceae bacterium]